MKEFKVDLEIITPMFLHGADVTKAEIRAPSIKGMMRYWWRAAKAEDDISKLKCEEADIFGSKEKRSKVRIRVSQGYSEKKSEFKSKQYEVGSKFSIILSALSAQDEDEKQLKQAIASLWLMSYFGGLGSRSRQGGGNLAVLSAKSASDLKLNINFIPNNVESGTDLSEWIRSNYKEVQKIINPSQGTRKYNNLKDARLKILGCQKHGKKSLDYQKTLEESLNCLRNSYKKYIRDNNLVEKLAKLAIKQQQQIKEPKDYGAKDQSDIRSTSRLILKILTSRLILKILKVNNIYYPVIILLKGPLLPENYINSSRGEKSELPDDNIIEEFFEKLKSEHEVRL